MSKDWPYAKMAEEAAKMGGPDKWLEMIKKAAYDAGASDMKNTLIIPLLLTGIGIGAVGVIGYQRIKKWISDNQEEKLLTDKEAVEAEKFLKKELEDAIEELEASNTAEK